jgi:hypothetical protein
VAKKTAQSATIQIPIDFLEDTGWPKHEEQII